MSGTGVAGSGGVGRASALMASGSTVSRVLGVVRDALLVACVGAEASASTAFNTANTLPNQIFALLQGGLLTTLFLPQITKAMRREDGGRGTIDALLTWSFLAVGLVTLVATLAAYPLSVVLNLSGPTLELGVAFAFLCLPQIFFYGAYTIWSQVLYARDRFGVTMWATVFANVVQIAGMGLFLSRFAKTTSAERWTPEMIWLLGGTFTLGVAVQAFALLPSLRASGFRWRLNLELRGHGFRAMAKLASWTIIAVTIAQLGGFVTTAAINAVTHGVGQTGETVANITVYLQAFRMFFVPHGIVTISILTAIFPRMTRSHQSGDLTALRADVVQGLRLPIIVMVPITFAAIALSVPGMGVVNPWMTRKEVLDTAVAFSIMALGLVPYAVGGLQQRYSMAREDGRTNLWFTVIVTGVQIATAALILVLPPADGVAGVACGMTLGNTIAAVFFLGLVQKQLGGLPLRELAALTGRLLAASLVPAVGAFVLALWIQGQVGWSWAGNVLALGAAAGGFLVVFVALASLFRIAEVTSFLAGFAQRLRRR